MTIQKKFSDELWAQARVRWERDGHTLSQIFREFSIPVGTIASHAKHHHWQRPINWVHPDEIRARERLAHDEQVAKELRKLALAKKRAKKKPVKPKKPKNPKRDRRGPNAKRPAPMSKGKPDRPATPKPAETADLSDSPKPPGSNIVPFPGGMPPPSPPPKRVPLLPPRTREQVDQVRREIAGLKGILSVQQLRDLENAEEIIIQYGHIIGVYLDPIRHVVTEGLDSDEAADKVLHTQKAALSILLPSERDTLAGAIKQFTASLITVAQLKRQILGLETRKSLKGPMGESIDDDGDDEDGPKKGGATGLGLPQLRQIRAAMETLAGRARAQSEPPKPPLPDPLDDEQEHVGRSDPPTGG